MQNFEKMKCLVMLGVAVTLPLASCKKSEEIQADQKPAVAERVEKEDSEETLSEEVAPMDSQPEVSQVSQDRSLEVAEHQEEAQEPFVLEDLSQIKLRSELEIDWPKLGDIIYTHKTVPTDTCGEYWVMDDSGFVERLSVCKGGEGHTHQ